MRVPSRPASNSVSEPALFPLRNLELVKWCGLFCMLVDHVNLFVLGGAFAVAEHVGALAFPLFAVALGSGVSRVSGRGRWQVVYRLLAWGVVAQFAWMLVRDVPMPLNVLFTLGAGAACATARGVWQGLVAAGLFALAVVAEFSAVGVVLTWAVVALFDRIQFGPSSTEDRWGLWWPCLALLGCGLVLPVFNAGSYGAFAAVIVVLLSQCFTRDVPRVRRFFYWAYVGQFPLLWIASRMVD